MIQKIQKWIQVTEKQEVMFQTCIVVSSTDVLKLVQEAFMFENESNLRC